MRKQGNWVVIIVIYWCIWTLNSFSLSHFTLTMVIPVAKIIIVLIVNVHILVCYFSLWLQLMELLLSLLLLWRIDTLLSCDYNSDRFLGNGSVNTFPRHRIQSSYCWKLCFLCSPCRHFDQWVQLWAVLASGPEVTSRVLGTHPGAYGEFYMVRYNAV